MPLVSIAILTAMALAYEILLIRVFAIVHWHHLVAIAISLALLGYGASGTFLVLLGRRLRRHTSAAYVLNGLLFGLSSVVCVNLAQQLSFDPQALRWDPWELLRLAGAFVMLAVPFFAAANCVGLMLWRFEAQIARIYGIDLLGAGAGALGVLLLLHVYSPTALLSAVMAGGLLAGLLGAMKLHWRPRTTALLAIGGLAAVLSWQPPAIVPAAYKDLSRALSASGATLDAETHGVDGLLHVVRNARIPLRSAPGMSLQAQALPPPQMAVFVDGNLAGTLPLHGDADPGAYLQELISALPYRLLERHPRVAVLGAGSAWKIRQAQAFGASRPVAVEGSAQLYRLLCDTYRDLQPELCDDAGVDWRIQAPRTFMAGSAARFDLIDLALDADADGLDALATDFSTTREALRTYLARLEKGGIIAIEGPTRAPPKLSMRLLATARDALVADGASAPADRLIMLRGWQRFALLIGSTAFTDDQIDAARAFSRSLGFDLVWLPGMSTDEANRYQQLATPMFHDLARALLQSPPAPAVPPSRVRLAAVSDDRPYPWLSTPGIPWLDRPTQADDMDAGWRVAVLTLAVVMLAALLLILLPLLMLGRRGARPRTAAIRLRTLSYFALIGGAFLIIEIAWIERLQLFLGHPVYATTAVLAAFLLFAGLGSLWCQSRDRRHGARNLLLAALLIGTSALVYHFALPPLFAQLGGLPIGVRLLLVILLLAPLAFAMGIPFPTALRTVSERAPTLVPWAWGINGCVSVVAAAATPLLGSTLGFSLLLAVASAAYLLLPLLGLAAGAQDRAGV